MTACGKENVNVKNGMYEMKYILVNYENKINQVLLLIHNENNILHSILGRICSVHFDVTAFKDPSWMRPLLGYSPLKKRLIKSDAVPTLNLNPLINQNAQSSSATKGMYCYYTVCGRITRQAGMR